MFNLKLNNMFEKRKEENNVMGINKENNEINSSNSPEMEHYQDLYSVLMDKGGDGVVTDVIGAKNTALELCKKDPAMVKVWAEEKDPVAKEGLLQSMLVGINKDQN